MRSWWRDLKDPATRARIRKDMETPSTAWDNEWHEIPGPEAILVSVVQDPKLMPLQGKTVAEIAKIWNKDPIDTIFDILIQDKAFTEVAVFGMSEPDVALALAQPWVSLDNDSQGTSPEGILGAEHPHPRAYGTFPRILRKYVREEHKLTLRRGRSASSRRCPPQRMRLTDRGRTQAGHVGRHRGVRPGDDPRPGHVRETEPALHRHGARAGERGGTGDRRRHDDQSLARQGFARPGLPAVKKFEKFPTKTTTSSSTITIVASHIRIVDGPMAQPKLTPLELEIMEALWTRGALSIREIQEAFPEKDRPAYTTIQTTVYRLEHKKAVRRTRKISNAHIFEAVVSRGAAQRRLVDELLSLFGGRTQPIMSHLIETGKLTLNDVHEAEKTLRALSRKEKTQ